MATGSRRSVFDLPEVAHAAAGTHAGLWMDKYLPDVEKGAVGHPAHLNQVAEIPVPTDYRRFYQRWRSAVQALEPTTCTAVAAVQGRMIVGLGAESVLETSIALHRTYGVPYIPGSALKGLAASAAHQSLEDPEWKKTTADGTIGTFHRILFGDQESSGHVTFHDALWIPEGSTLPLDLDVMTVHHPDYYQGKDNAPAADWDSPTPVAFLTAHGRYLLAVTGPEEWTDTAIQILKIAVEESGAGAKTAAGYGRMCLEIKKPPEKINWEPMIQGLGLGNAGNVVPRVLGLLQGDERRKAAKAMIELLTRKALKKNQEKTWAKDLAAAAGVDL
jgi:CRISPR-associated protein Cmr6